jgi:TPR repeat protein
MDSLRRILLLLAATLSSLCGLVAFHRARKRKREKIVSPSPHEARIAKVTNRAIAGGVTEQLRMGVMCAVGSAGWSDYRGAVFWFRKAAEQGEINAQTLLAMMCLEGLGTRRNYGQAARWARLAALQGQPLAQMLMGVLLEEGAGLRRNDEQALRWYQFAAREPLEMGARFRIGMMHLEGLGTQRNVDTALEWLLASAEKGDRHARFRLGMLYYDGRLVEQDYALALQWYLAAAEDFPDTKGQGTNEALFGYAGVRGEAYPRTVGQMMKRPPDIQRDAQFYAGLMYETGRGTELDLETSRFWYEKAAQNGDEVARQRVAVLQDAD